jgi:ABC-type polysaccharide/polyol phosphate export permease
MSEMLTELTTNAPWGMTAIMMAFISLAIILIWAVIGYLPKRGDSQDHIFGLMGIAVMAVFSVAATTGLGIIIALIGLFADTNKRPALNTLLCTFSFYIAIFLILGLLELFLRLKSKKKSF